MFEWIKKELCSRREDKKKENNERLSPLAPLIVDGKGTGHLRSLSVRLGAITKRYGLAITIKLSDT